MKVFHNYSTLSDLIEEGQDIEPTGAGSVRKTEIRQVWKNKGDKMMFLFDYGDCWQFIITLKNFNETEYNKRKYPIVSNIKGTSPKQYPPCEE